MLQKKLLVTSLTSLTFLTSLTSRICKAFPEEENRLVNLSRHLIEAKTNEDLSASLEELKELYLKDNRYGEFVDLLKSLTQKKKSLEPFASYYIAQARYRQLKYLEDAQKWDEYFSLGNNYREELTQAGKKAIELTGTKEPINIYSRLILWQFHKDQQDSFSEQALSDLLASVLEYSKSAGDAKPIKEVADKLLSYGEKARSRGLYKIYAEKLVASNINDDALRDTALEFYKEENLELAESIYDVYIDRVTRGANKEKLIPLLINIAREFSYQDQGKNDPVYAEKIFKKIEETAGKKVFDEEAMYLRAFNLEKAKEYAKAKDTYLGLILAFPETIHVNEAMFKVGIINTYVLRDKKEGRVYFEKLAKKEGALSPQGMSSLYQLGLLSQWEDNLSRAKEYYNKLIDTAAAKLPEIVNMAKERLKEIEEGKPIEYGLKTFLDVSLKEEYAMFDMTKLELRSHPYKANINQDVSVNATAYTAPSGCMQIELQYLWSGDLGNKKPTSDEAAFNTAYTEPGTKVINLVVVSPTGIIDRSLDLVDAQ